MMAHYRHRNIVAFFFSSGLLTHSFTNDLLGNDHSVLLVFQFAGPAIQNFPLTNCGRGQITRSSDDRQETQPLYHTTDESYNAVRLNTKIIANIKNHATFVHSP